MGQTHTATIIQQEALHSVSLNPHWRVVRDAEEINSCLTITPLLDQLSFDLSNSNWISSITINPLSYDPVAVQLQIREQEVKEQSRIVYKMEVPTQKKLRTAQTQTESDTYAQPKVQSQREQIKTKPKMIREYSEQPVKHQEIKRNYQQQNPYKLQNEVTENFSNDDDQSILSISQNFEALKQHQYDDKSYVQNQRFWSSDHSSFLIDIPNQTQKIPDQFSQAQRRLTQQQSFGQKQNQFQNFQGQQSPKQQNAVIQSVPLQFYSDQKQQQASKSPPINFYARNLPNSPKISQNQGQKESMRQQFDRLLRESQQKKQGVVKPNGKPVLKSSDSDQDFLKSQKLTAKIKSKPKDSLPKSGKSTYQQPTSYAERNKLKQKLNQSPPTTLSNLKQARNEIQKQKYTDSNKQLQKLNEKIEWISRMNQEQEHGDEILRQIKNNVSNLKTAITQNISPSERGDKNSNTNRYRDDEINLDNLPDFQEESINLDHLSSYRESLEKQRERLSYEN